MLGVDVGGTKVAVAALDGLDVARGRATVLTSSSALLDGLEETAREVIAQSAEPMAVGVGVPSQIEYDTGKVETSVNIPPARVSLREELGRRSVCPCSSTATRTWRLSQRRACSAATSSSSLTLGTGVGGGVVTGGRIFRGANGLGAELATSRSCPTARPAPETARTAAAPRGLPSGPGARTRRHRARPRQAGQPARGGARQGRSRRRARARHRRRGGRPDAVLLLGRFARMLGVAIAGYVNVFQPERIVIGGGLCAPPISSSTGRSRRPRPRPAGPLPPGSDIARSGRPGRRRHRRGTARRTRDP